MRAYFLFPLFFLVSCGAYDYEHENDICQCYRDICEEEMCDFDEALQEVEQFFIDSKLLKGKTAGDYEQLLYDIQEDGMPSVKVEDSEDSIAVNTLTKLKAEMSCAKLRLKNYKSKVNELNNKMLGLAISRDLKDNAISDLYLEVLNQNDFNHPLYKSDILILIVTISTVEMPF